MWEKVEEEANNWSASQLPHSVYMVYTLEWTQSLPHSLEGELGELLLCERSKEQLEGSLEKQGEEEEGRTGGKGGDQEQGGYGGYIPLTPVRHSHLSGQVREAGGGRGGGGTGGGRGGEVNIFFQGVDLGLLTLRINGTSP